MWIRREKRIRFQKAKFRESIEELNNPGCGWYHIYPFVLQMPAVLSLEEIQACISDISKREQLVLVRMDIGAFRSCEIPEEVLETIFCIFELFRSNKKQMIVRFTYDSEGRGMEREPQNIEMVKRHMEQLGKIVCEFSADILVLQGIFVGSWGEMHHSKFLSVSDMSDLLCCFYRAVKGSCYHAVRTPDQWRKITEYAGTDPAIKTRLGLFNDGLFGSATDLGTYREFSREEELGWQERCVSAAPNGGEAVAGEELTGYRQAAKEMGKMHLSYLNSSYQQNQLDYWRKECVKQKGCWNGINGYDYIGRHLGSRFRVLDAKLKRNQLDIFIENCGFSGFHQEAECFLEMVAENGETYRKTIDTNVSEWGTEKRIVLHAALWDGEKKTEGNVFFQMKRKIDGRPVRFANEGADDRVLLGRFTEKRNTGGKEISPWNLGIG